jgi:glucokinase
MAKKIAVAIDTGGTKIAGAAIDEGGQVLHKVRYPNETRVGTFILGVYEKIIDEMRIRFEISSVGIGAGGHIEPIDGRVLFAVDSFKDYIGIPIGIEMRRRCGLPVIVDNDARMALYGERWKGAAQGYGDVFGIMLGTGVGGGYICGGRAVYGAGCSAGEVGHFILYPNGRLCGCGQRGCVEQYLSGTALWEIFNERAGAKKLSSGYEFFELFDDGNVIAGGVLSDFVKDLAVCAVSITNILAPEAILFGGGLMDTSERWWGDFLEGYRREKGTNISGVALLRAKMGNDAALLGAAWSAFNRLGA